MATLGCKLMSYLYQNVLSVQQYLKRCLQTIIIAGIGRKGQLAAQKAFPNHTIQRIRHPSFGGKREFIEGMNALFNANRLNHL